MVFNSANAGVKVVDPNVDDKFCKFFNEAKCPNDDYCYDNRYGNKKACDYYPCGGQNKFVINLMLTIKHMQNVYLLKNTIGRILDRITIQKVILNLLYSNYIFLESMIKNR